MSPINRVLVGALALAFAMPASAADTQPACAKAVFPQEAVRYELSGTTELRFGVDEEGRAIDVTVAKSSRWEILDRAAVATVSACKFRPSVTQQEKSWRIPVDYVWEFGDGERSHPGLVEGSCAASDRFTGFVPFDKGVTGPDGVLVRLLVGAGGVPFGIKTEGAAADVPLAQAAIAYVQSCRFAPDPVARAKRTDTVTGRVLLK